MRDFHFTPLGNGAGKRSDVSQAVVRLSKTHVAVGKKVYESLGSPSRLVLDYDVRAKAIRLSLASHALEGYSVQKSDRRPFVKTTKLQQYLPLGEYLPISFRRVLADIK